MGPLGPTRAAGRVWTGSRRYLLEVISILIAWLRGGPARTTVPRRKARPTIAEDFRRSSPCASSPTDSGQSPRPAASSNTALRRSSTRVAARSSLGLHTLQRRLPAPLPGDALGLDLAPALRRQPGDDHTTIGVRARPLDVAAVGEVLEHLGDRRGRQPRRARQLSGRQLAALVQLDQQLELGVAELGAAEMRVASAQAIEAAKHATKRPAELVQLGCPLRSAAADPHRWPMPPRRRRCRRRC